MSHSSFRILHTSDWHLGNSLHERSRVEEYRAFLSWLRDTIEENEVDALLVSGDIFDTGTPSNAAEELYYSFLTSLNGTCCKDVIITAGNHDSPATLNSARSVLELLNVHVVATPDAEHGFANEIVVLPNAENPRMIVCAAPYLRAPALQASLSDEKCDSEEEFVRKGTKAHFAKLKNLANDIREKSGRAIPVVAMAHLFAAGASPSENADDSEYAIVGNLENVNSNVFPPAFDYVALGHIHRPQKVGGESRIRYSGSPLPMGFDEANRESVVLVIDFEEGKSPEVRQVGVPQFQRLVTISGDSLSDIREKIACADRETPGAWVRVRFTGAGSFGNLRQNLANDFEGTSLVLLQAEYTGRPDRFQGTIEEKELSEFSPTEVFEEYLEKAGYAKNEQTDLKARIEVAFQEILKEVQEGKIEE